MPHRRILLEVAVASLEDAITAQNNGADRLEVNWALELGGLTPSPGLVRAIHRHVKLPMVVMLRPHPRGFCYTDREFDAMRHDCEWILAEGAAGIAFGVTAREGQIHLDRCRQLRRQITPTQTVFHRAFDTLSDPPAALDQLIDLGFTRVLTSGGQPTAIEGTETIASLVHRAAGRIEILPGCGIRPDNLAALLQLTRCDQVHGSFGEPVSPADPSGPPVPGSSRRGTSLRVTSAQQVRAARDAADSLG